MIKKRLRLALAVSIMVSMSSAQAAILDFNSLVVNTWFHLGGTLQPDGWTINDEGFAIANTTTSPFQGIVADSNLTCGPSCPDNDTNYLLSHGAGFKLTPLSGDTFSLSSFDAGEAHLTLNYASAIQVIGTLIGGGTVVNTFTLDGINDGTGSLADFQTFNLTGFNNLTSVNFQPIAGRGIFFSIDNLNVTTTTIPEPVSVFLIAMGLVGIGLSRRKKQIAG